MRICNVLLFYCAFVKTQTRAFVLSVQEYLENLQLSAYCILFNFNILIFCPIIRLLLCRWARHFSNLACVNIIWEWEVWWWKWSKVQMGLTIEIILILVHVNIWKPHLTTLRDSKWLDCNKIPFTIPIHIFEIHGLYRKPCIAILWYSTLL